MPSNSTIIIVMKEPGGVTDYAAALAERLNGPVQVMTLDQNPPLDGASVLLQYSGYGYAKRGAPVHLLRWVRRNRPRMRRFGVFFHELYAMGKPTSSAFWLSPVQRYVASGLARASDFWLTSSERLDEWLQPRAGNVPNRRLAMFSTVGELPLFEEAGRQPILVVFGSAALRALSYRAAGPALFEWAARQGVAIHDVGSPLHDAQVAATLLQHGVVTHGRLQPRAIQALMGGARFGLTRYKVRDVAKSSVFAAYCAHGLAPILVTDTHGASDGLVPGTHYLDGIPDRPIEPDECLRLGRSAFDWYQGHSLDGHARATDELLAGR